MKQTEQTPMKQLASICHKNGYTLYGKDFFGDIGNRLDYELKYIERIPDGIDSLLSMAEYLKTVRKLCGSMGREDLWYTFRGPASSGLVPYLLGITNCNPMELNFYPWAFCRRKNRILFDLNLSMDMYQLLSGLELQHPAGLTLLLDRDLTDLESYNRKRPLTHPVKNRETYDDVVCNYFRFYKSCGDTTLLNQFQSFDEKYIPYAKDVFAHLASMDLLPQNLMELAKLNGFLHCKFLHADHLDILKSITKSGGDLYKNLISCPEDIYDEMISNGCIASKVEFIAHRIRRGVNNLPSADLLWAVDYCNAQIFEQIQQIDYLYCRSQIFEKSCLTAALMEVLYPFQ